MTNIEVAQISDMQEMTMDRVGTMYDIVADLNYMTYAASPQKVADILGVLAVGVEEK